MKINLARQSLGSLFSNPNVIKLCKTLGAIMYHGKRYSPAYEDNFLSGMQEIISTLRIKNMRQLNTAVLKISNFLEDNESISDRYFEMGEDFEFVTEIIEDRLSPKGKKALTALFKTFRDSDRKTKLKLNKAQEDLTNSLLATWQSSFTETKGLGLSGADRLKMLERSAKSLIRVARNTVN